MQNIPNNYNNIPLKYSWTYRTAKGEVLGVVARYQKGNEKKLIIPFFKQNEAGFLPGTTDKPKPLFGMEQLTDLWRERILFIPEGERACMALRYAGLFSLTWSGGAGQVETANWPILEGIKKIVLLPDNDDVGRKCMDKLRGILNKLESQPRIRTLDPLDQNEGGDVVDFFLHKIPNWDGFKPMSLNEATIARQAIKEIMDSNQDDAVSLDSKYNLGKVSQNKIEKIEQTLVVEDIIDFMAALLPVREYIVDPIFRESSLIQIAAKRGGGKTFIALGFAMHIASGSDFLGFKIPTSRRVLYLEPEMDGRELQERANQIRKTLRQEPNRNQFKLISYAKNPEGLFNLATLEGQAKLNEYIGDAEVIFIDSKAMLCRVGEENRADGYSIFQEWLKNQRRSGRCVIMTAHMGKSSAGVRGSSAQEDLLDVCIELHHPDDYSADQGLRSKFVFTKGRGLSPESQTSFIVNLLVEDGKAIFEREELGGNSLQDIMALEIVKLQSEGVSQAKIAERLKLSQPTVSRVLKAIRLNDGYNL